MNTEIDQRYMRLALNEAKKGLGRTSPNPCVGSVIVKNGQVIGRGYHKKAGNPHAEIHALAAAGTESTGATLYVTLEPCSHTGRTPPCCEAVARSGVTRVVVGMEDPNPLVQGQGIRYLLDRGITVTSGVLEEQCRRLNWPFIKHITTGLPWVVMKAGMSLDGRITYNGRQTGWMTGGETSAVVHRLRDRYDAILVGVGTVLIDDPALTTRLPGRNKGRDAHRVILDSGLSISEQAKVLSGESTARTFIFCSAEADAAKCARLEKRGICIHRVERDVGGGVDIQQVLRQLGGQGITSLLVEGGAKVHGSMLNQRLYDYAHLFYAPVFAGENGLPFQTGYTSSGRDTAHRLTEVSYRRCGEDMMVSGKLIYR
ncbi:MAG: bifunctional diaminohydroxyphosphoribosylaminopyrimidine deaminase/5-amino-6-(5-phosphoribosylamino)uracil reductase RibD [Desulfoprunum sp.]|uniref:bifunctional diaminohydroxyphosphoribosylaminopyrimidine deaminase/5-amino-6-(5-phosphoribosylamino)uracil reductase RibD n=1 Tax=Desulfoprunum sp. TaxID=2020866 RepID=UPI003C73141C